MLAWGRSAGGQGGSDGGLVAGGRGHRRSRRVARASRRLHGAGVRGRAALAGGRHWRAEAAFYRLSVIDPDADQRWPHYLSALLAVSGAGVLLLYVMLRLQAFLPYSLGHPGMSPALAWDTAVSFTTNTSWQN